MIKVYWNDEDSVSGLYVGDRILATICQENGIFFLTGQAGNIRFCYDILSANTLDEAKEEASAKIKEVLGQECERAFAEYVDLATDYAALVRRKE